MKPQLPVDDAMPERLPQARLTITVESLGLASNRMIIMPKPISTEPNVHNLYI